MNVREIRVCIETEPARYKELYSAMMEGHEYNGCYVMQYSEFQENGYMVAVFMLRQGERSSMLDER